MLDVAAGKFLDTSLIQVDVQPSYVRLLIKGKLLQLLLPCEVKIEASAASRSTASGHLILTMPKEDPNARGIDMACVRPGTGSVGKEAATGSAGPRGAAEARGDSGRRSQAAAGGGAGVAGTSIYNIVRGVGGDRDDFVIKEVRKATVVAAEQDDDDVIPDL